MPYMLDDAFLNKLLALLRRKVRYPANMILLEMRYPLIVKNEMHTSVFEI